MTKRLLETTTIYDKLPEGWKFTKGATTAPSGYAWINNGKSLFSKERKYGLLKLAE